MNFFFKKKTNQQMATKDVHVRLIHQEDGKLRREGFGIRAMPHPSKSPELHHKSGRSGVPEPGHINNTDTSTMTPRISVTVCSNHTAMDKPQPFAHARVPESDQLGPNVEEHCQMKDKTPLTKERQQFQFIPLTLQV